MFERKEISIESVIGRALQEAYEESILDNLGRDPKDLFGAVAPICGITLTKVSTKVHEDMCRALVQATRRAADDLLEDEALHAVKYAENLDQLCDAINAAARAHWALRDTEFASDTSRPLGIDLMKLPVFGGVAPRNTRRVCSWDETRCLVRTDDYQPGFETWEPESDFVYVEHR